MPFGAISRSSLEILNQNYRLPGVLPRPVPPGRGNAPAPQDPDYCVADEFIRMIPFVNAGTTGRPFARHYQVRVNGPLEEPPFTARASSAAWMPGTTSPAGEEFELSGARFKKVSRFVRVDELMVGNSVDQDMLEVQIGLARTGIVRALSEAVFASNPPSDDNAELAGLPFFLPAGSPNDIAYDPARGLRGGLSELEARVAPSDGDFGARADVFVMSSRARWRLMKELEDKGVTPDFSHCPLTGRVQLHYHGIPVVIGRVPEPAGHDSSEAWALRLLGSTGVRILHFDGERGDFGVRTEPATTVAGLDAGGEAQTATRGVNVFGVYSLLVPEPNAIGRLRGVPVGDPYL